LVDKKLSKQQQQYDITIFYNLHKEEEGNNHLMVMDQTITNDVTTPITTTTAI
jgi:hypothetical protein